MNLRKLLLIVALLLLLGFIFTTDIGRLIILGR